MKTFKTYYEEVSNYIGKNIVYATKDTSGGGTTSFTSKGKVVDHNKKYDVITLDNGVRINTHLHYRKDGNLYHKGDFYIDNLTSAEDNLLAVVARAAVGKALINKVLPEDGEDRCKRKADSVYGKKTSAYKSGSIVRCRKGKIWKKK
tara:strand:+ start:218 stop:658 length:441 start_codon:yes stop_codon:yes gene_type:complete